MSNHLSMDRAQSIQHLRDLGWSQRKIAATLAVDRKSVKGHLEGVKSKGAAPTGQAPTGQAPTGQAPTAPELAADDSKGTSAPKAPAALPPDAPNPPDASETSTTYLAPCPPNDRNSCLSTCRPGIRVRHPAYEAQIAVMAIFQKNFPSRKQVLELVQRGLSIG